MGSASVYHKSVLNILSYYIAKQTRYIEYNYSKVNLAEAVMSDTSYREPLPRA